MFKVMAYGCQCGIFSSRALEEACRYRVDFMWLLEEENPPDHTTFARFRTGRCAEAAEDLFYQYVRYLEAQGETDHETGEAKGADCNFSMLFAQTGSVSCTLSRGH